MLTPDTRPGFLDSLRQRLLGAGAAAGQRLRQSVASAKLTGRAAGLHSPPRRALRELLARLADDQAALDQTSREVESRFLAASGAVRQLASLSRGLLEQSQRLDQAVGSKCGESLQSALQTIREQLSFVGQCQEANVRMIGRLERHAAQVQALRRCDAWLDRILLPLQTTCILFKTNAVSLPLEGREFFEGLTRNVQTLETKARNLFHEQVKSLQGIQQQLDAAMPRLQAEARRQGEQITAEHTRIDASLTDLERASNEVHRHHERLAQGGQRVSAATSDAVVGLQYQDITRQKSEHVAQALEEMRGRLADMRERRFGRPPQDLLAYLRQNCRLQARHLGEIQQDLAQAQQTIHESLSDMIEELKRMDAACQEMRGTGTERSAFDGMAKGLLESLADARTWMRELRATTQTASELVFSFDKTASDTASTLRHLALDIHLTALNAQVSVARLSENTGLGVLSAHTSAIAREIRQFSETVGDQFDTLIRELRETEDECRKLDDKARTEQQWLEEQGRHQETRVVTCRDNVLSVLQEVAQSLQEAHQHAAEVLQTADFREASSEGFEQFQATLEDCCRFADRLGTAEGPQTTTSEEMEVLKKRYTMESERALHAATLGDPAQPVPPVSLPGSVQRPLSAAGPPQTPAAAASVRPTAEATSDSATAPATAAANSGLGDNVELF